MLDMISDLCSTGHIPDVSPGSTSAIFADRVPRPWGEPISPTTDFVLPRLRETWRPWRPRHKRLAVASYAQLGDTAP